MSEKRMSKRNKKSVGIFEYALTSYDKLAEKWQKSVVSSVSYRVSVSKAASNVRKLAARSSEKSVLLGTMRRFISKLPAVTLRAYGTFIFSLGFYSALVYVIKAIATTLTADMDALIFSGMLILVSIPLLLSTKTLAEAVLESRIGSFIAFDILGCRPEAARMVKKPIKRCDLPMVIGMVLGLCSFYCDIEYITVAVVVCVVSYFAFTVPEGGVVAFVAFAPLMNVSAVKYGIWVLTIGYVCKILTGKRAFKLDFCDSIMLVFGFTVLLGDTVHYGNGTEIGTSSHVCAILLYFLIVNLIRNDKWKKTCRAAVVFGGALTAVMFVASCYLPERLSDLSFASGSLERTKQIFTELMQNADSSALYIAAVIPMLMADVAGEGEKKKPSGGSAVIAVLMLAAAVMSGSRSLWLSVAIGVIVFLIFLNRKFVALPVAVAVLIPISFLVLPDEIAMHIKVLFDFSGEGTVANVNVRENSIRMLLDNFLGGIGSADGVFSSYYAAYTGTETAPDSAKNLFLGVGVALGVTGLVVFVAALLLLFVKMYTYAKVNESKDAVAIVAGFVAMLSGGLTVDVFADSKMFLLFFIYSAFVSAYTASDSLKDARTEMRFEANTVFSSKEIEFR